MKAKYIGCTHDSWKHTELWYEYRGKTYCVVKHNNGYMDKSIRQQHADAQADIDMRIETAENPIEKWEYKGSGFEGFDVFWEYVNGDEI